MKVSEIKQIEYKEAPELLKMEMIKNQILIQCDYANSNVDFWIENTLNPWLDKNIEGIYSLDLFRPNATEPTNTNNILFKKFSRETKTTSFRSLLLIRFSYPKDIKNFQNQCMSWKLSI